MRSQKKKLIYLLDKKMNFGIRKKKKFSKDWQAEERKAYARFNLLVIILRVFNLKKTK